MILYIVNNVVLWYGEDVTIKEREEFINDECCIVVDKQLEVPTEPTDNKIRVLKYNSEKQELYYEIVGTKEVPHEEVTKQTYEAVEVTTYDNLTNMDMLMSIDEKLNMIMEHLGLIS